MEKVVGMSFGRMEVKPGDLQRELRRVWREAAQLDEKTASKGSAGSPRVRAVLSNFIILVSDLKNDAERRAVDALITELCLSYPSRFFIIGHSDSVNGIRTAVSSRCVRANSGAHVCSEEVYIEVARSSVAVSPNLLLSLLVPDVPVFLKLPGVALPNGNGKEPLNPVLELFSSVIRFCDRIIYDSAEIGNYAAAHEFLFRLVAPGSGDGCADGELSSVGFSEYRLSHRSRLIDLNWIRALTWRTAIAEWFEQPAWAAALPNLTQVHFDFCAETPSQGQSIIGEALLLGAWLGSKLTLSVSAAELRNSDRACIRGKRDDGSEVVFEFRRLPLESGQAPTLLEVRFAIRSNEPALVVSFHPESQGLKLSAQGKGDNLSSGEMFIRYPRLSSDELLLSYLKDPIVMAEFKETVEIAAEFAKQK